MVLKSRESEARNPNIAIPAKEKRELINLSKTPPKLWWLFLLLLFVGLRFASFAAYATQLTAFATTNKSFTYTKAILYNPGLEYLFTSSYVNYSKLGGLLEKETLEENVDIFESVITPTVVEVSRIDYLRLQDVLIRNLARIIPGGISVESSALINSQIDLNLAYTCGDLQDTTVSTIGCLLKTYSFVVFDVLVLITFTVYLFKQKMVRVRKRILFFFAITLFLVATSTLSLIISNYKIAKDLDAEAVRIVEDAVAILNNFETATNNQILTDSNTIKNHLTNTAQAPLIMEMTRKDQVLRAYLIDDDLSQTFLSSSILPLVLQNKSYLSEPLDVTIIYLPTNKLIVHKFNQNDLQLLLPVLSKNIITNTFGDYELDIERDVDFEVLNQVDYQEFQEKKEEEYKVAIRVFVAELQSAINETNNTITHNQGYIKDVDNVLDELDNDYDTYVKDYQETYDKYCKGGYEDSEDCKELKELIEKNTRLIQDLENDLKDNKEEAKQINKDAEELRGALQVELNSTYELLNLIEENPVNTEFENGVFFPFDDVIKIKYVDETKNEEFAEVIAGKAPKDISEQTKKIIEIFDVAYASDENFTNYLLTSVHEYLHFTSDKDDANEWPNFLEESTTEYLSIVASYEYIYDFDKVGKLAYSDAIKVLRAFLTKVSEEELTELYFEDKSNVSLVEEFKEDYETLPFNAFETQTEALFYMGYDDLTVRGDLIIEIVDNLVHDSVFE